MTFVEAVLPVPSITSDFSRRYSLRQISTRAIGLDEEGQTGGLRLTLAGESYFNFGYAGVAVIGCLFGVACAYLDVAINKLRTTAGIAGVYVSTLLFIWMCFGLYRAGTQASATIKIGLLLTGSLMFLSRQRVVPRVADA